MPTPSPRRDRRFWLAALALVAVGALLRLLAARGDLWLDEIWSLQLAGVAGSVAGVFTALHHDNNHYLNTVWLLWCGPAAGPLLYRAVSVASGAVMLAALAARPLGLDRGQTLAALLLNAVSPLLVVLQSEARGYGLAMACAVAGALCLGRLLDEPRPGRAAAFAAIAVAGLLAHLTFLFALTAFAAWSAVALLSRRDFRSRTLACFAVAFAFPGLALGALWALDLRVLKVGGGPEFERVAVLRQLLRETLGLQSGFGELAGALFLAAALFEVARLIRARRAEWAFYLTVLVLAPTLVILGSHAEYQAPRYFSVAMPFLLVLVGSVLARLWDSGWLGRGGAALLLAVFLVGSARELFGLVALGRGHYREAVAYLIQNSPPDDPTIGSDHDFRNPMLLAYFARQLAGGDVLQYEPQAQWTTHAPRWFIRHDPSETPDTRDFSLGGVGHYHLERQFPFYGGISGWHWLVYRRADSGSAPGR